MSPVYNQKHNRPDPGVRGIAMRWWSAALVAFVAFPASSCTGAREVVQDDPNWRIPMAPSADPLVKEEGPAVQPVELGADLIELSSLSEEERRALPGAVDDRCWNPAIELEQTLGQTARASRSSAAESTGPAKRAGEPADEAASPTATPPAGPAKATGRSAERVAAPATPPAKQGKPGPAARGGAPSPAAPPASAAAPAPPRSPLLQDAGEWDDPDLIQDGE